MGEEATGVLGVDGESPFDPDVELVSVPGGGVGRPSGPVAADARVDDSCRGTGAKAWEAAT